MKSIHNLLPWMSWQKYDSEWWDHFEYVLSSSTVAVTYQARICRLAKHHLCAAQNVPLYQLYTHSKYRMKPISTVALMSYSHYDLLTELN